MTEQLGFDFTFPVEKPWRLLSVDELYDKMSEQAAVDADEDHRIERKSSNYSARPLGDYFSMWANTPPFGGILLIGIENDGRITGCKRASTSHMNDLQRAGDVYCSDARYECRQIPVLNIDGEEDYLLAFRVFYREDRVVETASHEAYSRRGSSKRHLSNEEKRELQLTKGQIEIESEPSTLAYPSDFNVPLVHQFVENVRRDRGLPETLTVEEILELRRLGKLRDGSFRPNLACATSFTQMRARPWNQCLRLGRLVRLNRGRVAQRESIPFTRGGSQVQSLPRPPFRAGGLST